MPSHKLPSNSRRAAVWLALPFVLALAVAMLSRPAAADSGSTQVALAANGRYDQLEQLLEAEQSQGKLKTRDRHTLCFAYSKTKRYDKLIDCLDKLQSNVRAGDRRTRLFGLDDATPSIHLMRADAMIELGLYAKAVQEAQTALAWLVKDQSDDLDMVIHAHAAMSLAYTLSGDKEAGERKAAELARMPVLPTSDYAGAKSLSLGRAYMALGQYGKAVEAIESDRTFKLRSFLDNVVSGAYLMGVNNWVWAELPRNFMITKAMFETGRLDEARRGYDELLKVPQVRANGEIYWQLLDDRGRLADQDGQLDVAIGHYRKAVDVIEQQRLTISTEANKIGFVGDKQAVYGRLVDALFRAGRSDETFDIIERSKSRAFVDLLAAKEQTRPPPLATARSAPLLAPLLEQLRAAGASDIAQVSLEMGRAGAAGPAGSGTTATAQAVAALRQADPELASLVSVTSVPLPEIRALMLPGEIVLQYYMAGDRLYAVTVSNTDVRVTAIQSAGLDASVRKFRKMLQDGDKQVDAEARLLHDRLIRPIEPLIEGKGLLVVPHGVLHYLPFAALHDGRGYLLDRHPLRYLPSASVLKFVKPSRDKGIAPALVLGNPDLGDPQYDLPNAELEAKLIAGMGPRSELLLRKAATKDAFTRLAPGFRTIHVASHGEFNGSDALQSRLLLSPPVNAAAGAPAAAGGDLSGSLSVSEIYGLRLDADLVTLSACETGLGKVLSGDDVLGLTRGFLYAGTRNVVASHWQVDDLATSVMMKHFYQQLLDGVPKREALRNAQLATRREFPHPFFWAAFFLTGAGV